MTVSNTLVIKIILAIVSLIFVWFGVSELFNASEEGQLLSIGAVGFALAAIILP